jgi:hypothetical protein
MGKKRILQPAPKHTDHQFMNLCFQIFAVYPFFMGRIGAGRVGFTGTSEFCPPLNGGHGYDFTSSVGHLRLDSVGLLVYDGMCTIFGAPMLYFRSLWTMPTMPRRV